MTDVTITIGADAFRAHWERTRSPATCAAFAQILPFSNKLVHARWSGEACWVPLGDFDLAVGLEHPVSQPGPGQLLYYPAAASETEILVPYGATRFNSVAGELAGNHFLTIVDDLARLARIGQEILWSGRRDIRIEFAA